MTKNQKLILYGTLFVLLLEFAFLVDNYIFSPRGSLPAAVISGMLVSLTNEERQQSNIPELAVSPALVLAAQMQADDMAQKGYFAHTSPEGKSPWYWLNQAGYEYTYAGENLAVNFSESSDVVKAWMNSSRHRANIVKSNFTEMGIAVAKGFYKGREAVFVVQFFGTPVK